MDYMKGLKEISDALYEKTERLMHVIADLAEPIENEDPEANRRITQAKMAKMATGKHTELPRRITAETLKKNGK